MFILATAFILAIRTPVFQTWIVKRVTAYLSSELNTRVEIDGIRIEFFRTLSIKGLYIEDLRHDTLLYAGELSTVIDMFAPGENKIFLSDVELNNATVKLQKYKNVKGLNLDFIIDYFDSGDKDTTASAPFEFSPGEVRLNNVQFVYRDNRYDDYFRGVDFEDIRVLDLHAVLDDIRFEGDTVYATVQHIDFNEKSGFSLEYFETNARITPVSMDFENLLVKTPHSRIQGALTFNYSDITDFEEFIQKVRITSSFEESMLSSEDLVYFATELEGLEQDITFSGKIKGTIDQLRGRSLDIAFADHSTFRGDISIAGLPDFEDSFFDLVVEELVTDLDEIESIRAYPFHKNEMIDLPENLATLGEVTISGKFTGFLNDFVAYGNAQTRIGYVSSDINLKIDSVLNRSSYSGHLSANGFDVGVFTGNKQLLGQTTFKANVTGYGLTVETANAKMEGIIHSLSLNGYTYNNIDVNAQIAKRLFNGYLKVNEENLALDFNGTIDLTHSIPVFDFRTTIDHAMLTRLKLIDRDSTVSLSTTAEISVRGKDIDALTGYIRLGKTEYIEINDTILIDSLTYTARSDGEFKSASLRSNIVDFNLKGNYKRSSMYREVEQMITSYIPILRQKPLLYHDVLRAEYDLTFKHTEDVTRIFIPELVVSPGTHLKGHANSTENSFSLNMTSDSVRYAKAMFSGVNMDANTQSGYLTIVNHVNLISVSDTLKLSNVNVDGRTNKNESRFSVAVASRDSAKTKLVINGDTRYMASGQIMARILPSTVVMEYKNWEIDPKNTIVFDSSRVTISNLVLTTGNERISLDGTASKSDSDRLNLVLENFDSRVLNPVLAVYDVEMSGVASGSGTFAGVLGKPGITSDMFINDLALYGDTLGDATIDFNFLTYQKIITLKALVDRGGIKNIEVNGKYIIKEKDDELDFDIILQKTNLSAFSGYAKGLASDIRGKASGQLKLKGTVKKPELTGNVRFQQASFLVDYLNTRYSLADEVEFTNKYFRFKNITVNDENGNRAIVDGYIYHNNLSDFSLDFSIKATNFQMLNTRLSNNELYYGEAYGSGNIRIYGPLDLIVMKIAVRTEKNTQIFIPLSNPEEVSKSSYINFISPGQVAIAASEKKIDFSGIEMDFELDVTDDAEVQLIFDSKIGDIIKGRGNGNITMRINTTGDFTMYGEYQVVSGDYLFTLQNLINKRFIINPGGTIRWNGSPYDAVIDLEGVYKLKANLYDLIQDTSFSKRIPVLVNLSLKDNLFNPTISFEIEVPDIDPTAKTLIDRYISTEQEKSMQTMSLLVLNRFSKAAGVEYQGTSSSGVSANAAELLSQQLSVWASQISDVVNVGVKYRAADAFSQEELEVALSTQLFNDRVSVEGSFGVSDNNSKYNNNTSNLVGDFNAELKLSKDGKLRAKAFNKTINNSILNNYNSPYTQGVGLFYREEFNTLGELFRKYFKMNRKEEDPLGAIQPDP